MARVIDSNLWAAPQQPGSAPAAPAAPGVAAALVDVAAAALATSTGCEPGDTMDASPTPQQLEAITGRFGPVDASRLAHRPPAV